MPLMVEQPLLLPQVREATNDELILVTERLLDASRDVEAGYFEIRVAGTSDAKYRERVYCYELYHRWRSRWPAACRYTLAAEVDKGGHSLISGAWVPDFIVHIPGEMENLLAIEVKATNGPIKKMAEDLKKLTLFRRALSEQAGVVGNYHAAWFWLYGPLLDWPALGSKILNAVRPREAFDPALVRVFHHATAGSRAVEMSWPLTEKLAARQR